MIFHREEPYPRWLEIH